LFLHNTCPYSELIVHVQVQVHSVVV